MKQNYHADDNGAYKPSEEEIRAKCEKLQEQWDYREKIARRTGQQIKQCANLELWNVPQVEKLDFRANKFNSNDYHY